MVKEEHEKRFDVEVEGPLGLAARFYNVSKTWFVAVAMGGLAGYFGWLHWTDAEAADTKIHKEQTALLKEVIANQQRISSNTQEGQKKMNESLDAMTYVLALPQSKREALKLDEPDSIRRRRLYGQ